MGRYAFLIQPSHNRVYADASAALVRAELEVFSGAVLGGRVRGIGDAEIGGVRYVTFDAYGIYEDDRRLEANE